MKKNPTFGEFIRLTRKEKRGLPLVALSKKIGISAAQLQRIEENQVRIYPDEKFLEKLSKSLEVDYETLVDLLYHHKTKKTASESGLRDVPMIPWEFLSNIQNISPETIANGYTTVQLEGDELAIAVVCKTEKWQPFIAENDLIILLVNTNPKDGDMIVIENDDGEYDVLKVAQKGDSLLSFPAFPAFHRVSELTEKDNYSVIGIVAQIVRRFR
ncbi:helix-turn-helix transcriptional regulator [bacterium]|jgi:transcriptional regulator with XRE-family HTH domain|nr:helix-turn-helix transcriptional regulator [bacterium]